MLGYIFMNIWFNFPFEYMWIGLHFLTENSSLPMKIMSSLIILDTVLLPKCPFCPCVRWSSISTVNEFLFSRIILISQSTTRELNNIFSSFVLCFCRKFVLKPVEWSSRKEMHRHLLFNKRERLNIISHKIF